LSRSSPLVHDATRPDEASGAPAEISHEQIGDGSWLFVVEGELDLASAGRLRDALSGPLDDGAGGIVFDLARCSFVDSSGLAVLMEAHRSLSATSRGGVAIVAPGAQPRRLLELTATDGHLEVFESRDEAEAAIGGKD
jgi:anti-anti-sigma factor